MRNSIPWSVAHNKKGRARQPVDDGRTERPASFAVGRARAKMPECRKTRVIPSKRRETFDARRKIRTGGQRTVVILFSRIQSEFFALVCVLGAWVSGSRNL